MRNVLDVIEACSTPVPAMGATAAACFFSMRADDCVLIEQMCPTYGPMATVSRYPS